MITLNQTPFLSQALFNCEEFLKIHGSLWLKTSYLKFLDIFETPTNIALWCILFSSLSCFLEKPHQGGKRQRSSNNKRIRDSVIEKRPKRDRKLLQKRELDQRLLSICTKLVEGNVKAVIRIAVSDDRVADFTVDNYAALRLKYP